jgi:hypothetical protein
LPFILIVNLLIIKASMQLQEANYYRTRMSISRKNIYVPIK